MKQAPTGLVTCCNSFLGMLRGYLSRLSFFALSFSVHTPRIESFFRVALRALDRVYFKDPPAHQMVVHGRALVCLFLFPNSTFQIPLRASI